MMSARTFASWSCCLLALASLSLPVVQAQKAKPAAPAPSKPEVPEYYGPQPATEKLDLTMYARIREEGLRHSHVMQSPRR